MEFRKWAKTVLKKYILEGYSVNTSRIQQLGKIVRIMKRSENRLDAKQVIAQMRFGAESALFGNEKNESFNASIGAIYQTFDGNDVYRSTQEKAANLLYFVTKNHRRQHLSCNHNYDCRIKAGRKGSHGELSYELS